MRIVRPALILFAWFLIPITLNAQQVPTTAPRDPQSITLLQRSLIALVGTSTIKDVTLTGNVRYVAGSDDETGTAVLKATYAGQGRIDLSLSDGPRSEVVDASQAAPTGSWRGSDGTWHAMVAHNLYSDPTWFFPAFFLNRALSNVGYAITSADLETRDGTSVQHIGIFQQSNSSGQLPGLFQNLSRVDIYLDSTSLLPVALKFDLHADKNIAVEIPAEIRFSDYRTSSTGSVAYHIQRLIQNSLVLDVQTDSVQFNSGLSSSQFAAQ